MNDEYVHGWDSPVREDCVGSSTVRTTPEQLLSGLTVETGVARCTDCARALREGERILVYAYRMADNQEWTVARHYCRACRSDELDTPTLCASEALVEATLGTLSDVRKQTHEHYLLAVDHVTTSPPSEGRPR